MFGVCARWARVPHMHIAGAAAHLRGRAYVCPSVPSWRGAGGGAAGGGAAGGGGAGRNARVDNQRGPAPAQVRRPGGTGAQSGDRRRHMRERHQAPVPSAKDWSRRSAPAQKPSAKPSAKPGAKPAKSGPAQNPAQRRTPAPTQRHVAPPAQHRASAPTPKTLSLPRVISLFHLARALGVPMRKLQFRMEKIGLTDVRPDTLLRYEDAELLAAEYNIVTAADEEKAFDILPRPPVDGDAAAGMPLRPPVVSIMGHVDHGKTTLLDRLRSTSVAAGEAGGITQHIGAFSVPVAGAGAGGVDSVTFLDTPGHAAFSMMRSRGASVTDVVVLVVAADDGVMPQTEEVIKLVRAPPDDASATALVIAISKMDAQHADAQRVRYDLLAHGVEVEDLGGDVPCVELSAKTGAGVGTLQETLAVLAEMADLRADASGRAEGRVLESRVDRGRGNVATVLVQRGALSAGDVLVSGTTWARVRQLTLPDGRAAKRVLPGHPVLVAGWRELPGAGDEFVGAPDEAACKRAVENRKRVLEQAALLQDAEQINRARRRKAEEDERRVRAEREDRQHVRDLLRQRREGALGEDALNDALAGRAPAPDAPAPTETRAELRVMLKGDYSGTVEALAGAVGAIGNPLAGVRIVSQGVGEPTAGDVQTAHAVGAHLVGFNVKAPRSVQQAAAQLQPRVPVHCDDVIYRLMEYVTEQVAALLPPVKELRVQGEALVAQLFDIKGAGGRASRKIAGCRVTNGVISRAMEVRVMRGEDRAEVFRGRLDALRQVKKDVAEMRKGTECGVSFDGFDGVRVGDVVQCVSEVEVPRKL
ncbi:translation initiation factor IF-2 [Malassezia sp. CBS 17886]|nr:translation initiation factor IF-2 [Malassezia sp. CBS 17886]